MTAAMKQERAEALYTLNNFVERLQMVCDAPVINERALLNGIENVKNWMAMVGQTNAKYATTEKDAAAKAHRKNVNPPISHRAWVWLQNRLL